MLASKLLQHPSNENKRRPLTVRQTDSNSIKSRNSNGKTQLISFEPQQQHKNLGLYIVRIVPPQNLYLPVITERIDVGCGSSKNKPPVTKPIKEDTNQQKEACKKSAEI